MILPGQGLSQACVPIYLGTPAPHPQGTLQGRGNVPSKGLGLRQPLPLHTENPSPRMVVEVMGMPGTRGRECLAKPPRSPWHQDSPSHERAHVGAPLAMHKPNQPLFLLPPQHIAELNGAMLGGRAGKVPEPLYSRELASEGLHNACIHPGPPRPCMGQRLCA